MLTACGVGVPTSLVFVVVEVAGTLSGSLANAIGALVATIATASQKASARFVYELFINHSSFFELETKARPLHTHFKSLCLAVILIIGVLLLAVQ